MSVICEAPSAERAETARASEVANSQTLGLRVRAVRAKLDREHKTLTSVADLMAHL